MLANAYVQHSRRSTLSKKINDTCHKIKYIHKPKTYLVLVTFIHPAWHYVFCQKETTHTLKIRELTELCIYETWKRQEINRNEMKISS